MKSATDAWDAGAAPAAGALPSLKPTPLVAPGAAVAAAAGGALVLPEGVPLALAQYARDGADLLIAGADGRAYLIRDFFALADPPELISGGQRLAAEAAARLAVPRTPAREPPPKPPGEAVGQVEEARGAAAIMRADGSRAAAEPGARLFPGDVVETAGGSAVGLAFADDTVFSLGQQGRMVLGSGTFASGGRSGEAFFFVLKGAFTFLGGHASLAESGVLIRTPSADIAVRGAAGGGIVGGDGATTVALFAEKGGRAGELVVGNGTGALLLDRPGQALQVSGFADAPGQVFFMDMGERARRFGGLIDAMPGTHSYLADDAGWSPRVVGAPDAASSRAGEWEAVAVAAGRGAAGEAPAFARMTAAAAEAAYDAAVASGKGDREAVAIALSAAESASPAADAGAWRAETLAASPEDAGRRPGFEGMAAAAAEAAYDAAVASGKGDREAVEIAMAAAESARPVADAGAWRAETLAASRGGAGRPPAFEGMATAAAEAAYDAAVASGKGDDEAVEIALAAAASASPGAVAAASGWTAEALAASRDGRPSVFDAVAVAAAEAAYDAAVASVRSDAEAIEIALAAGRTAGAVATVEAGGRSAGAPFAAGVGRLAGLERIAAAAAEAAYDAAVASGKSDREALTVAIAAAESLNPSGAVAPEVAEMATAAGGPESPEVGGADDDAFVGAFASGGLVAGADGSVLVPGLGTGDPTFGFALAVRPAAAPPVRSPIVEDLDPPLFRDPGAAAVLAGTSGADFLVGGAASDRVAGLEGGDFLYGDAPTNLIAGLHGLDDPLLDPVFAAGGAADFISGGAGDDAIWGGAGDDQIHGDVPDAGSPLAARIGVALGGESAGADAIHGGAGDDALWGGGGADTLAGGAGDDTLEGGAGADEFRFAGGAGADVASRLADLGIDAISDYSAADGDVFGLANADFGLGGSGTLPAGRYAETATQLAAAPQDLSGGAAQAGIVVVGAAAGAAGFDIYYTENMSAASSANSYQVARVAGANTGDVEAADFVLRS